MRHLSRLGAPRVEVREDGRAATHSGHGRTDDSPDAYRKNKASPPTDLRHLLTVYTRVIREGVPLPPVSELITVRDFHRGEVALSYAASQLEVAAWLARPGHPGARRFVDALAARGDFFAVYPQVDSDFDDAPR